MTQPRAFSYLRFSTPEQQRGDSFRRQTEMAERYAAEHGLALDNRSFADLGVSAFRGANAQVGMLGEFRRLVADGTIAPGSFLLVESLDRLSRAVARKATRLLEDLCEAGIVVITLADAKRYDERVLNEDPMAFMWAFMVAMRAHEESAMKSGRLRASWEAKRHRAPSVALTALAPAWLTMKLDRSGFDVIEERAAVVRRIYEMTDSGMGQHAIASALNASGVPTFGRAKFWHRSYVKKLLASEAVIGKYTPHRIVYVDGKRLRRPVQTVAGYFPPILDVDLFNRVRGQHLGAKAPKGASPLRNMLAGLARCPQCLGTMTRVNKGAKGGQPYLVCAKAKAGAGCKYHAVRLSALEDAIMTHIGRLALDVPKPNKDLEDELQSIRGQKSDVESAIRKAEADIAQKGTSWVLESRLSGLKIDLQQRKARYEEVEQQIAATAGPSLVPRVRALIDTARRSPADRQGINARLRQLFSGVTVLPDQYSVAFRWLQGGETEIDLPPEVFASRRAGAAS